MPPDTDWPTDLLPPAAVPPAAGPPLHERLRRAARSLAQITVIAGLSALLLVICWAAVVISWAMWKAR